MNHCDLFAVVLLDNVRWIKTGHCLVDVGQIKAGHCLVGVVDVLLCQ